MDYFVDFMFLLDVILRLFFFAFINVDEDDHKVVDNREVITDRYMKSFRFILTMMILFPIDLFAVGFGELCLYRLSKVTSLLLVPTLVHDMVSLALVLVLNFYTVM